MKFIMGRTENLLGAKIITNNQEDIIYTVNHSKQSPISLRSPKSGERQITEQVLSDYQVCSSI